MLPPPALPRTLLNILLRLALLATVAALIIAAVWSFERSRPALLFKNERPRFHRPLAPQPLRAGEFAEELLILAATAFLGRKVLRLRL
ncbi:MAG TPA: hypothetical protein VGN17_11200 [Bryobacteraceae bacterium]|jgi:hypothetical protein